MIISPSLLSCDFLNIGKELEAFESIPQIWFHLDIMDGHFVPNMTFGIPIVQMISKRTSIPLDAHLMVTNPEFHIEKMKGFGLHNITFHLEATLDPLALILEAKKYYPSVGISLKPNTEVGSISSELLETVDLILIMSVEPGFGGQSFMESSLLKLRELDRLKKIRNYHYQLQVDGGINQLTAPLVKSAGANNLVAGNYIFKEGREHYRNKIDSLR